MSNIKLLIASAPGQNLNDLTVILDEELSNVSGVRLEQIRIPITFYNISEALKNNTFTLDQTPILIPDGFYDFNSFTSTIYTQTKDYSFHLDNTTGTVKSIPPISISPFNLRPFSYFFIHCDLIDTSCNLFNGKRSDILTSVLIRPCRFNQTLEYNLNEDFKKCDSRFNCIRLRVTDENQNPILFNHGQILYTLNFAIN